MTNTDLDDIAIDDSDSLTITVKDTDGVTAKNITGFSIHFTLKKPGNLNDADADAIFAGTVGAGITITNAAGGIAKVAVPKGTTSEVTRSMNLQYDCRIYDQAGGLYTTQYGAYPVVLTATRANT